MRGRAGGGGSLGLIRAERLASGCQDTALAPPSQEKSVSPLLQTPCWTLASRASRTLRPQHVGEQNTSPQLAVPAGSSGGLGVWTACPWRGLWTCPSSSAACLCPGGVILLHPTLPHRAASPQAPDHRARQSRTDPRTVSQNRPYGASALIFVVKQNKIN